MFDKGANMALVEHCWGYPKKLYLTKIKYAGAKKEMLCLSLVETFMQLNGTEDFQLVSRFTITEISDQPPSDDKFTLAAFGIGTGKSGVKWYFWMVVGGIAILLALYLARKMRWFDRAQSFLGR